MTTLEALGSAVLVILTLGSLGQLLFWLIRDTWRDLKDGDSKGQREGLISIRNARSISAAISKNRAYFSEEAVYERLRKAYEK